MAHLLKQPGASKNLFQYVRANGTSAPVSAAVLRNYVRAHTNGGTVKDFRTFHASNLFAQAADKVGPPTSAKDAEVKIEKAAMAAAKALGHKKGKTRKHFVKHAEPDRAMAKKHGGKVYAGGHVGFHSAKERKAYQKALGDTDHKVVAAKDGPKVKTEWGHIVKTALDNYIDPTVVEAYRQGLTISGSKTMEKARGVLSKEESAFAKYLEKLKKHNPFKRGKK